MPRPEVIVGAFAASLQWLVLRPLLGPFIYADELGYVAAARYFGPGYPEVQLQSGFFHAGYGLLLSPLTIVFDEPQGFHRAATTFNGLMLVLAAILACRLVRELYGLDSFQTVLCGGLFAASTSVMISSGLLWAESTLTLLVVVMATFVRRAMQSTRQLDVAVLVFVAVAAYAIHPRGIAMTAAVAFVLIILARDRGRWGPSLVGLAAIVVGFIATRELHALTADRLFAGSALTGSNSSFRYRFEELILGALGPWTRGLLGTAWYQLMASAGLVAIATWEWLRSTRDLASGRGATDRGAIGVVLLLSAALTWAMAGTIVSGEVVRIDHTVYGRYLDHIAPLAFSVAGAILLTSLRHWSRPLVASAVLVPGLGWAVSLWWGLDFYDAPRQVAPINAPVHATMTRIVENNLPGVIGVVAAVGIVVLLLAVRWQPRVAVALSVVVLAVTGFFTVRNEVRPHSRDTVNLRAMADAVEAAVPEGTAMIAEPFAFLNTYAGQYWADDVQFVLATECPAHPYDAIIAAVDDQRYLDHRILFTDPRSDRQLLEPSPVGYPIQWQADVSVVAADGPVESGGTMPVTISVTNTGDDTLLLPGEGPRPLSVAYRIVEAGEEPYDTAPIVVADLSTLSLAAGETRSTTIDVPIPGAESAFVPGRYEIVADLFVGGIGWVNEAGCPDGFPPGAEIEITPSSS